MGSVLGIWHSRSLKFSRNTRSWFPVSLSGGKLTVSRPWMSSLLLPPVGLNSPGSPAGTSLPVWTGDDYYPILGEPLEWPQTLQFSSSGTLTNKPPGISYLFTVVVIMDRNSWREGIIWLVLRRSSPLWWGRQACVRNIELELRMTAWVRRPLLPPPLKPTFCLHVCAWVWVMYTMYIQEPTEVRRSTGPLDLGYRWLWASMRVLGTDSGPLQE